LEENGDRHGYPHIKNFPDGLYERLKARAEQQQTAV